MRDTVGSVSPDSAALRPGYLLWGRRKHPLRRTYPAYPLKTKSAKARACSALAFKAGM
jgi:hypothetical protein